MTMMQDEYISATDLAENTFATLDAFDKGEIKKMIILKNNAPRAVLLSMKAFQAMQEELEDLRLTSLALIRQETFDPQKALSHERIMEKFAR